MSVEEDQVQDPDNWCELDSDCEEGEVVYNSAEKGSEGVASTNASDYSVLNEIMGDDEFSTCYDKEDTHAIAEKPKENGKIVEKNRQLIPMKKEM